VSYRITIPKFEGPLDLLLFLIRKNEMDITDISIASITRQYMGYLETMQVLNLEHAGDYILMASTLMNIKSKMLLPTEEPLPLDEIEDPRADLVRRLQAYQAVKNVAADLKQMEFEAANFLPRAFFPELSSKELEDISMGEVTLVDFLEAFRQSISKWETVVHRVAANRVNLEQMITRIIKRLGNAEKVSWRELFTETADRLERILILLSLLEMSRLQQVSLKQTRAYGNLWVVPLNCHEFQRAS
jgi:segregation and condensation protein A